MCVYLRIYIWQIPLWFHDWEWGGLRMLLPFFFLRMLLARLSLHYPLLALNDHLLLVNTPAILVCVQYVPLVHRGNQS